MTRISIHQKDIKDVRRQHVKPGTINHTGEKSGLEAKQVTHNT